MTSTIKIGKALRKVERELKYRRILHREEDWDNLEMKKITFEIKHPSPSVRNVLDYYFDLTEILLDIALDDRDECLIEIIRILIFIYSACFIGLRKSW